MKNFGVLLHISSLPSEYGIGDLGPGAYQFADILVSGHQILANPAPLSNRIRQFAHTIPSPLSPSIPI